MTTSRKAVSLAAAGAVAWMSTGCIVISSCSWSDSPRVWMEATEELTIEPGMKALEVLTHNGTIDCTGQEAAAATVTVRKKAGGRTTQEAQAAMDAIEVTSERTADGLHELGWRWRGLSKSNWRAQVSFAIKGPGAIRFEAETHNGAVSVVGVTGEVRVETHNGKVYVESRDKELYAKTHNGAISATYAGPKLTLITHNGKIDADLSKCGAVRGEIATHNGAVEVAVGAATAADVMAETLNGAVTADSSVKVGSSEKNRLEGKIGAGGQRLELETHNGSIRIKHAAG